MKKFLKILGLVLVAFIAFYFLYLRNSYERKMIKDGNKIIAQIENYRVQKGYLPESLNEIGIEELESGPHYYDVWDSINYTLYFGTSLGESMTYYSDTKKWSNQMRTKNSPTPFRDSD